MAFIFSLSFNLLLCVVFGATIPFFNHINYQLFIAFLLVLIGFFLNQNTKRYVLFLCFFIVFVLYANSNKRTHDRLIRSGDFNQIVTIEEPLFSKKKNRVRVTTADGLLFYLRLNSSHKHFAFNYGDRFQVKGKILPQRQPTNPGEFNAVKWLYLKGISGEIYPMRLQFLSHSNRIDLKWVQFWIKKKILAYHQKMLPDPLSDLFTGLIFGEHGTALPQSYKTMFKKTGLTHLLVVSGSQVALIVGIVFVVLQFFNLPRNTILFTVAAAALFFYGITGGGASVLRAVIMSIMVSAFKLYQYRVSVLYVIANTAILMISIDPLMIFDFGAYLSFLATLSLIYGVPFVSNILPIRWPLFLKTLIAMSLAPFFVTLPFLWFFFHKVSLISVVSNLIMVPLIELLVVLGFFSTLIGLVIPTVTMPLMMGIRLILDLKITVVDVMSQLSWAEYSLGRPSVLLMITLYLVIGCCVARISCKMKRNIWLLSGISLISLVVQFFIKTPHFTVTILDVGQGDCIIIECPNGKTLLIDSAKSSFVARQVILPYLAYRGINVIDTMIITHYDKDHYGGLGEIIRSVKVNTIIDNGNLKMRSAKLGTIAGNIPILSIQSGDRLNLDPSVNIRCLSSSSIVRPSDKNNRSISLLIQYQHKTFLFTGDLESIGEKWISRVYDPIDIDVLKLGHHGSKTSSTPALLKWCTPEIGIVSAGRNNRYKHPHPSVLNRCQLFGISVFRTDLDGAIKLSTDGTELSVSAYLKRSPILSVVH